MRNRKTDERQFQKLVMGLESRAGRVNVTASNFFI